MKAIGCLCVSLPEFPFCVLGSDIVVQSVHTAPSSTVSNPGWLCLEFEIRYPSWCSDISISNQPACLYGQFFEQLTADEIRLGSHWTVFRIPVISFTSPHTMFIRDSPLSEWLFLGTFCGLKSRVHLVASFVHTTHVTHFTVQSFFPPKITKSWRFSYCVYVEPESKFVVDWLHQPTSVLVHSQ